MGHVVEQAGRLIIGGIGRTEAIRAARRLCRERKAVIRVRFGEATIYTARPESNERRKACDCPAQCWGARREQHSIKCRPARPACRWRRRANGLCTCVAYHYPHRTGSGRCLEGPKGAERYEQYLRTPRRRAA